MFRSPSTASEAAERLTRLTEERRKLSEHLRSVYDTRIIVAGSRDFDDYACFQDYMHLWLEQHKELLKSPYCFISGDARSGPDRMIKTFVKPGSEWSKNHIHGTEHSCYLYPALWNEYRDIGKPKIAGMVRNREMGEVGTHLIAAWDKVSPGTKGMIEFARSKRLHVSTLLFNPSEQQTLDF